RSMPSVLADTPRKMFPPPMTMPTSTPIPTMSRTSWAICCKVLGEIPYFPSPINASPLSFRRMRLNRGREGAVTGRGSYLAPRSRSSSGNSRDQPPSTPATPGISFGSVGVVGKPFVACRARQSGQHLHLGERVELDVHGARLQLLEPARRRQQAAVERPDGTAVRLESPLQRP